jgi:N-acetylmuramoyl-L-alanine amidase
MRTSVRDPPLNARSLRRLPGSFAVLVAALVFPALAHSIAAQNPAVAQPQTTPLTLLTRDGRRPLALTTIGTQEFVGLDDLASAFQLTVREEAGAVTVSYKGRTIVMTPDQALASVGGRLISLPAPPARLGSRWAVPVEFVSRALALIYDLRLDLRRPSHLLVVGDLRVPRVVIRYEPLAAATRLTIDTTPRATSAITEETGRVVIKFDADAIDVALPAFQSQGFVTAIRVVDPVTVIVELGPRYAAYHASSESIADTVRLVVDLVGAETPQTTQAAPAVPPPPTPELPTLGRPAAIRTIAVDAGHGGEDGGVKGPGGTLEKDLVLAVARRLKTAIEARLGIRVLLTRDDDRNVPIDERAAIANNSKADLFISLHASGALRGSPRGASFYVAAFGEDKGARTALAPERVATFGGGSRDIELVEWRLAQLRFLDQSKRLAGIFADQSRGRMTLDDQQAVTAGPFRVLESANMPAILVELGYLTNADEEKALGGAEFQNTFAQVVIDSVAKFRDALEQGSAAAAP